MDRPWQDIARELASSIRAEDRPPSLDPVQWANESFRLVEDQTAELTVDGKPVSLEDELVKSGEIRHACEMNTAIVSAFNCMILMTAKGS